MEVTDWKLYGLVQPGAGDRNNGEYTYIEWESVSLSLSPVD